MPIEIPSKEVTEAEIVTLNNQLESLGLEAKSQGLEPVDLDKHPMPESIDELSPTLTVSGFWGHYIGGGVSSVAGLPPDMSDLIGPVQKSLHILTQRWMTHPVGEADELNLATCRAFLNAGFAFDWTKSWSLLDSLQNTLADIGDQYSLRIGRIPLGYTPRV